MSTNELKACPHCGAPGEVLKLLSSSDAYPYAAVARCTDCHHGALGISQDAANRKSAESWNKRVANHDPAQVVVMGRKEVAKVRELLHDVSLMPELCDSDRRRADELLSLLPAEEMRT